MLVVDLLLLFVFYCVVIAHCVVVSTINIWPYANILYARNR